MKNAIVPVGKGTSPGIARLVVSGVLAMWTRGGRSLVRRLLPLIFVLLRGALFPACAAACADVTVRDAAFTVARDVHRLSIMAQADDPVGQAIHDQLEDWMQTRGANLNIELVDVAADAPEVRWDEYGIPSAPPSLPVAVLAGSRYNERRGFFIDHWEPNPTVEDLEVVRTSPARELIRSEVVRRVAVLLYVPGTDGDAGRAEPVLDAVVKRWSRETPLGLSVVSVDRSDERERLLLSFIGIKDRGPDWVAVVFGRGKTMSPLEGPEITEARLDDLIMLLVGECTCLRPPSSLGVDIPMTWDEKDDGAVVALRARGDGAEIAWSVPTDVGVSFTLRRAVVASTWTFGALILAAGIGSVATIRVRNRRRVASAHD